MDIDVYLFLIIGSTVLLFLFYVVENPCFLVRVAIFFLLTTLCNCELLFQNHYILYHTKQVHIPTRFFEMKKKKRNNYLSMKHLRI